ncbi:MAG: hypothetical protein ACQES2_04910 [Pseudomonadota bacterium]
MAQQSQPQWFIKKELPPVNTRCLVKHDGRHWPCLILAHHENLAVFEAFGDYPVNPFDAAPHTAFRPVPSEDEQEVKKLNDIIFKAIGEGKALTDLAGYLHDKGVRPASEGGVANG